MSPRLTVRQTEILDLISCGFTYYEIAEKLGITQNTMWSHTKQMYARLGVRDAAHAVRRGFEIGLLSTGRTDIDALRAELGRVYAALVAANNLLASRPVEETSPSHPFGDYLLGLVA